LLHKQKTDFQLHAIRLGDQIINRTRAVASGDNAHYLHNGQPGRRPHH